MTGEPEIKDEADGGVKEGCKELSWNRPCFFCFSSLGVALWERRLEGHQQMSTEQRFP